MPDTTCHMSISLDGFVAGPNQSREHPLGMHGIELHGWHIGDERANEANEIATGWLMRPRGAYLMGRNKFGQLNAGSDTSPRQRSESFDAVQPPSDRASAAGRELERPPARRPRPARRRHHAVRQR